MPPPSPPPLILGPPAQTPRWADVPTAPTDLVMPASGRLNVGLAPSERPPAQWLNWLWNLQYRWIIWLRDFTYYLADYDAYLEAYRAQAFEGTVSRTRQVNIAHGRPSTNEWDMWMDVGGAFRLRWEAASVGYLFIPLDRPDAGGLYTSCVVRAKPSAARATGFRMFAAIVSIDALGAVVVQSSQVEDDGSTAEQNITVPITGTPSAALSYAVFVSAGGSGDHVYGVSATYNDPTPRRPT